MLINKYYSDAFIVCNVKANEHGDPVLDIPFRTYHQTICHEGVNRYCNLTKDMIGKEVLVYIHYSVSDGPKVFTFDGYLGDNWKAISEVEKVKKHWFKKKKDALAKYSLFGDKTDYDGDDKEDIIHPYYVDEKG